MGSRRLWVLGGLTLLAAAVRFATLDVQSYWLDEAITVKLFELPFGEMTSRLAESESNPPLYYVVGWVWAKLFGTGELGLRSLSAVCGTALVPVAYAAAARLVSARAGLIVAALVALNPFLVHYSQEARSYSLLMLLAGLSFLFFARLEAGGERYGRGDLAAWALFSALALATHYFALFVVAPEAIWLLVRAWRARTPLAPPAIATALVAAVGAALLPLALDQRDNPLFIAGIPLDERLARTPKQFLTGFAGPLEAVLGAVAIALVVASVWLLWRRGDRAERHGALVAGGVGAAAIALPLALIAADLDYWDTRNLIAAWLPLAVVLGAGLGASRAAPWGPAVAVVLCAVFAVNVVAFNVDERYQRDDWRSLAEALGPEPPGGRAIVVVPGSGLTPLEVYIAGARRVPAARGFVRTFALVALGGDARDSDASPPPRPRQVPPPLAGLTETRRDYGSTYSLVEFRSAEPLEVAGGAFITTPLDPARRVGVLLEGATQK